MRDHLEVLAERRREDAIQQLTPRPVDDSVLYLKTWLYELHGRSGMGMNGLAPLTYTTIADWARLKGETIEPFEVDALLLLDGVLLNPESNEQQAKAKAKGAEPVKPPRAAWPMKKAVEHPTSEG